MSHIVSDSRDLRQLDPGALLVISGPSGTGKSTLCRAAMNRFDNMEFSVSFTTRPARVGEAHGRDYYFVDVATFDAMIEGGRFAEYAVVHDNKYGTSIDAIQSRIDLGINVILDIDSQGARQIKERYHNAVFIFFVPPSMEVLEQRLRGRGTDSPQVIEKRLKNALSEIQQCSWYDYIVVNDEFNAALDKFCAIILAEKCRRSRSMRLIASVYRHFGVTALPPGNSATDAAPQGPRMLESHGRDS